jgi:RNA methyltransferase, TrmH family
VEGPNLVAEALRAGLRIDSVFLGGDGAAIGYQSEKDLAHLDVLLVPGDVLRPVLDTESPQLFAALIEPPDWTWAHLFGSGKRAAPLILVLAGIQDPGNLGTILRSAEAFGADGVISLPGTVNAWNPKAVRASAGSVFRIPMLNVNEEEAFTELREAGLRLLTTTVRGAQPADLVDLAEPIALVIGNEGNGVPVDLAAKTDEAVTIPCPGPVESLNAAVAASVLLYEAARQRAQKSGGPSERRGGTR